MPKIMFFDLETQNHKHFGAVASPRHPENYVVLNGWAIDEQPYDGPIEHIRNDSKEQELSRPWMTIPDDVWLIVAHNAPYEMDWLLYRQRPEIQKFLKRGGRVFCTAYAHYLLTNQRETYPALDEIAPLYGGEHKVDGIKALWEQGVLTADIDPALLLEYLISPTRGDIANTRKIFYGQYTQLVERGMWEMALERMEGMVFCSYAMDAGLVIDKDVAEKQMKEGEDTIAALRVSFAEFRNEYPAEITFKETSDFQMSAWLFGGPIKYRHKVAKFNDAGLPVWEKGDAITWLPKDCAPVLLFLNDEGKVALNAGGELTWHDPESAAFDYGLTFDRYKSGKNKGLIKVTREDTTVQKKVYEETTYTAPALVDLTRLSDTIREEFLKDFTGKRKLADDSPVISTGKDALEFLSKRKEFPAHVQKVLKDLDQFNKLDKDIGTYYLRNEYDDEGNVVKQSGMLQYMNLLNIVHHNLNCTATVTTRLSSNKPNFQNLPRGNTSDVKKMFVSRYDSPLWLGWALHHGMVTQELFDECTANIAAGIPNGYIVELDYKALEVVTLACFSQDKALIKALEDDLDMHCMRLAAKLNEPYASVLLKCKDQKHPEHAAYDEMRTDIKPPSFAYQYGATAMGIAFSTGMSVEDAQAFIDREKALFPGVELYFDERVFPAVEQSTTNHREQDDEGNWVVYGRGFVQTEGGTCYEFRQYPKVRTEFHQGQRRRVMRMEYKPTQMRNYPIQGESGFFVQGICGQVIRWLIANDFFGGRVTVINTVHDAIYLDCHRSVLDVVCAGVKAIMESLPSYFSKKYGYNLNVPFPAAAEFGLNMHSKTHWHEGVLNEAH